jgi:hypothetical protein
LFNLAEYAPRKQPPLDDVVTEDAVSALAGSFG